MKKFTVDAPKERVVKTLQILGFYVVREKELEQSWVNTLKGKFQQAAIKFPPHITLGIISILINILITSVFGHMIRLTLPLFTSL